MINHGTVRATEAPEKLHVDECSVWVASDIQTVTVEDENGERTEYEFRAGDHAVVKTVSARLSVCAANGFFSIHVFPSVFQSSHDRFRPHFFKMSTIFAKSSFASLKIGSMQ